MVAITFDDGPHNTAGFCKVLNAYGAKGTFFFVGNRLDAAPNEAKVAQTCGEVADHTENHIWFNTKTTFAQAYPEFANDQTSIEKAGAPRTFWARPRGGIYNSSIIDAANKAGQVIVNWNIKAYDYGPDNPTRQQIINRVVYSEDLKPGAIILLHQTYGHTIEALPTILSLLRDKGYKVTTVSELIANSY
jgi:peptidoglycan/xylan/chitin deacetylase (PgdA/CDA1 family)